MVNVLLHIVEVLAILALALRVRAQSKAQGRDCQEEKKLELATYRAPAWAAPDCIALRPIKMTVVGDIYRRSPTDDPFDSQAELLKVRDIRTNTEGRRFVQVQKIRRGLYDFDKTIQEDLSHGPESIDEEEFHERCVYERP